MKRVWTKQQRQAQAERARKTWQKRKNGGQATPIGPKRKAWLASVAKESKVAGSPKLQSELIPTLAKLIRMLPDALLVDMVGRDITKRR
jgi:hypothetical protein